VAAAAAKVLAARRAARSTPCSSAGRGSGTMVSAPQRQPGLAGRPAPTRVASVPATEERAGVSSVWRSWEEAEGVLGRVSVAEAGSSEKEMPTSGLLAAAPQKKIRFERGTSWAPAASTRKTRAPGA